MNEFVRMMVQRDMEAYDALPREFRDLIKEYGDVSPSLVTYDPEYVREYLEGKRRVHAYMNYGKDHPNA